jgi:hypothetical protein
MSLSYTLKQYMLYSKLFLGTFKVVCTKGLLIPQSEVSISDESFFLLNYWILLSALRMVIYILRIFFSLLKMTTDGVPNEHMHCFNILDDIPNYEPMGVVRDDSDLYETVELEWHHWENSGTIKKKKKKKKA